MSIVSLAAWPRQRWSWGVLAAAALSFELTAAYFQHGMGLEPCVMCIYERLAMLGLLMAGVIGCVAPQLLLIRLIAFATWLGSSVIGLKLSWEHYQLQVNPPLFATCGSSPDFPSWLPLNHWFPGFFEAYGICEDVVWSFAGIGMVEWLVIIFGVSSLVALFFTVIQWRKH